ncbi:MAG: hypothetical protein HFG92_03575 [Dorea sp.]|nr:hypothetical protein [Dorea sp.]MCI9591179.1 hypothetical protein [Lachnospiraceae bacterium]
MIQDAYVEQLVKRKNPPYALPVKILLGVVVAVSLLMALASYIGIVILLAACGVSYFTLLQLNTEFEYLYIDGQLSIDRIMNRNKRKKVLECDKDSLLMMAPADSYVLKDYEAPGTKTVDCSSGQTDGKKYAFIYQSGQTRTKVIFEPNDRMLQCIRNTTPRKVVL